MGIFEGVHSPRYLRRHCFSSGYIYIISKLLAVHADKSAFPRHPRKRCLLLGGFFPGNHAPLRYWKSGQVEKCTPRNGRETSSMFSSAIYISFQSYLPSMPINQPFLGTRGRDAWFLGGFFPGNHAALRYWKSGRIEKCRKIPVSGGGERFPERYFRPRKGRETCPIARGHRSIYLIQKQLAVHLINQLSPAPAGCGDGFGGAINRQRRGRDHDHRGRNTTSCVDAGISKCRRPGQALSSHTGSVLPPQWIARPCLRQPKILQRIAAAPGAAFARSPRPGN